MKTAQEDTGRSAAVIVANGDYPAHPLALQALADAPYVVCCDGGADGYIARGGVPDAIVGDGDSLSGENRRKYARLIHCVPDQETNDQTKAVRYLLDNGRHLITIVGATGKREDHTIGNVSLLIEYMRMGAQVRMITDYGIFLPCRDTCTFDCRQGQQFSIFNFTARGLRADGLVYPLSDFTGWWQGTLNECTGATLTVHAQGEYLVFLVHSPLDAS
ncbi:MAG: thiamine diphosphokinase [Prevotellaceae bacterium]|jgi:thiamine pyrophosphokinase|nr:thiamine diphosphokinase [Prevotellaceae bacterium]